MIARIVERTRPDGTKNFVIQKKFLFVWFDVDETSTLSAAKQNMCFYDGTKVKDRVVDEEAPCRISPETKAIVARLQKMFEERLESEDEPDVYLDGLAPSASHELEESLQDAVNESAGKVYVLNSPLHGRRFILVAEEFAQKLLAMGGFPN